MSDRLTSAIERARSVLGFFATESVAKGIWGSPAGKKRLADRLVRQTEDYLNGHRGNLAPAWAHQANGKRPSPNRCRPGSANSQRMEACSSELPRTPPTPSRNNF